MGSSGREAPFFFAKPGGAALPVAADTVGRLPYPPQTANLHHEVELVVAIGAAAANLAAEDAYRCVFGHAVGLDMTRRDIHSALKDKGRPWELAKAFDHSAPVGALTPLTTTGPLLHATIDLSVNGQPRQRGDVADMIWSAAEILAILSGYFTLQPGDLIFTGTPAGVGPVERSDRLLGRISGLAELALDVV
jgi:fumarylpyruvate hydrolase